MNPLGIAIIGCGLIGNKRARALGGAHLIAAADTNLARAKQLSAQHSGCVATDDLRTITSRKDLDVIIPATTNAQLAAITHGAVKAGKHVLVEKPAARNAAELEAVATVARKAFDDAGVIIKVGFNHRFHPAL